MNHADNQGELHSGQGAQLPVQGPWGETTSSKGCCALLSRSVQLFVTPWTVACEAPLTVGILQARSGLPCSLPG